MTGEVIKELEISVAGKLLSTRETVVPAQDTVPSVHPADVRSEDKDHPVMSVYEADVSALETTAVAVHKTEARGLMHHVNTGGAMGPAMVHRLSVFELTNLCPVEERMPSGRVTVMAPEVHELRSALNLT